MKIKPNMSFIAVIKRANAPYCEALLNTDNSLSYLIKFVIPENGRRKPYNEFIIIYSYSPYNFLQHKCTFMLIKDFRIMPAGLIR